MARVFVLNGVNLGTFGTRRPEVYSILTHYSYALHDALEMVEDAPKVEVHLSSVHVRELWRGRSVVAPAVNAVVAGMGPYGYEAAVGYILGRTEM